MGDQVVAVGMEYSGPTPQPLFLMGNIDGIGALLRDVIRSARRVRVGRVRVPAHDRPHLGWSRVR